MSLYIATPQVAKAKPAVEPRQVGRDAPVSSPSSDDDNEATEDEADEIQCDPPPCKRAKKGPAQTTSENASAQTTGKNAPAQTTGQNAPAQTTGKKAKPSQAPGLVPTEAALETKSKARSLNWAPPPPPSGHHGAWPTTYAKPFPPNGPFEVGQFVRGPPPWRQPGPPPPPPVSAASSSSATGKAREDMTRKEKNALKKGRGSGRLGKWCMWMHKAKAQGQHVLEEFFRHNPQPANAEEGHTFVPKMPPGLSLS